VTEHNWVFWAAQSVAALAFVVMFWSSYSISRRVTIVGRGVASVLFTTNYLLLGMWSAAGVAGLNSVRSFAMSGVGAARTRRTLALVFIAVHTGLFVFVTGSFDTWLGVLPLAGAIVSTFSFSLERVSWIKALTVANSCIWISYFLAHGLWVNIAGDAVAAVLAAIACWRALKSESAMREAALR
jgi:hypothetical protein